MMVARFRDGRLAFLNAVPLREESMREMEAWGTPAFLVVPAGSPRVTPIARLFIVGDRARLRAEFLRLAAEPGLVRIVPCHGRVVRERAPEVLREAASAL